MITAVDSNVVFDIFLADPNFGEASARAMRACIREGRLVACEAVWAEVASLFPDEESALREMGRLGVHFSPLDANTSLAAGTAWRQYRARGGPRKRIVADFLIGAHASGNADRLLTRDSGFFRDYFSKLTVLDPTAA